MHELPASPSSGADGVLLKVFEKDSKPKVSELDSQARFEAHTERSMSEMGTGREEMAVFEMPDTSHAPPTYKK